MAAQPPFAAAIVKLHAAMARVANGDVSAIKALYSHTADATSFSRREASASAWRESASTWSRLLSTRPSRSLSSA